MNYQPTDQEKHIEETLLALKKNGGNLIKIDIVRHWTMRDRDDKPKCSAKSNEGIVTLVLLPIGCEDTTLNDWAGAIIEAETLMDKAEEIREYKCNNPDFMQRIEYKLSK